MTLTTAAHLIAAAKARIENLSPAAVAGEVAGGEVLLVDIREAEERAQHGSIPGAIHTARGMLEFAADPTSAYYHPAFDPGARIILYCASGGRSALAASMLHSSATPGWPISTAASGRGWQPVSPSNAAGSRAPRPWKEVARWRVD